MDKKGGKLARACSTDGNSHHSGVRPKRKHILFAVLLCITLAIAVIAICHRNDEPRYEGKRLSQWLEIYDKNSSGGTAEFTNAFEAVWTIGTNALPLYLKWIQYEESPWRRQVRRYLPRPMKRLLNESAKDRQHYADLGFYILETNAAPAIPELIVMMKDWKKTRTSATAIYALTYLGESAIPALKSAMVDTNQENRIQIFESMRGMVYHNGTNHVFLSLLREALNDPDAYTSALAEIMLEKIDPAIRTNEPTEVITNAAAAP